MPGKAQVETLFQVLYQHAGTQRTPERLAQAILLSIHDATNGHANPTTAQTMLKRARELIEAMVDDDPDFVEETIKQIQLKTQPMHATHAKST